MGRLIASLGSAVILFVLAIAFVVGALLFPYALETWATFFGKPLVITWYIGLFITMVMTYFVWRGFPGFVIAAAIFTWLCEIAGIFS